jgi:hypothetical protein
MIFMFKCTPPSSVNVSSIPFDGVPNVRNGWFLVRGTRIFGRWRTTETGKKVRPADVHQRHFCY